MTDKIVIPKDLRLIKIAQVAGIAGVVLSAVGYFLDANQFAHSWLVAFAFWLSIALGGLFLTLIHYLSGATWSVLLRRVPETFMYVLPFMAIFFLPIILGSHNLYHWTDADAVAHDKLLQSKAPYLNTVFFIIRALLFFGVWSIFSRLLYKHSIQNDESGDAALLAKAKKLSPPAVILFALTVSFAAFDWLMSLDPHWYSTIFGLYYFAGSTMATYSFLALFIIYFEKNGPLKGLVTTDHYHDLGKLIFTFTIFWAYMAFSQYFLIWYANIPEETVWFMARWQGSWKIISLLLAIGHFAVPFLILMIRAVKRNTLTLAVLACWLLFMHFIDMFWLVMPTFSKTGARFNWMDLTTFVGIGGLFLWLVLTQLAKHSLVPFRDPNLGKSLTYSS